MTDKEKLPSIDEIDKRIVDAKKKIEKNEDKGKSGGALSVGIDLVAGVLTGSFIGYQLDMWANTLPLFFIICFFLGVAGSFLNMYKKQKMTIDKD